MSASAQRPAEDQPQRRFGGWMHPLNLKKDFQGIYEANRISAQVSAPKFLEKKGFSTERATGFSQATGALMGALYLAVTVATLVTAAKAALQIATAVMSFSPALAVVLSGGVAVGACLLGGIFVASGLGLSSGLGKSLVQGAKSSYARLTGKKPAPSNNKAPEVTAAPLPSNNKAPEVPAAPPPSNTTLPPSNAAPPPSNGPAPAPEEKPEPARQLDAGATTGEAFKNAAAPVEAPSCDQVENKPATPPGPPSP